MIIALYKLQNVYKEQEHEKKQNIKQNDTLEHVGFQTMFKITNGGRRSDGNG